MTRNEVCELIKSKFLSYKKFVQYKNLILHNTIVISIMYFMFLSIKQPQNNVANNFIISVQVGMVIAIIICGIKLNINNTFTNSITIDVEEYNKFAKFQIYKLFIKGSIDEEEMETYLKLFK